VGATGGSIYPVESTDVHMAKKLGDEPGASWEER
jgi:hypothetical protein